MTRLAAAHFVANAVILSAGYYWLGIPESRNSTLALSAALALVLTLAACVTYGAALAFFAVHGKSVGYAWKIAVRNLLPIGAAALAIAALYWLLSIWQDYSSTPAFTLASFLTMIFRSAVKPGSIQKILDAILFLVRWAVLPAASLPAIAAIVTSGWSGFAQARRSLKRWWYWIATPLLLLAALIAPLKILSWKPHMGSFTFEMMSFLVRASVSYLLFGAAWLTLAFATSAGKPRFTQSNTAVSP